MSTVITKESMFAAAVHLGHRTCYRDPNNPYVFGSRNGLSITNLDQTELLFNKALAAMANIARTGGVIVFVGTKMPAQKIIATEAIRCGMPYVDRRWLGGLLTNYKVIKQSVKRKHELQKFIEEKRDLHLTKKERLTIRRQLNKLDVSIGGISDMTTLPDALFVVDIKQEAIAVLEARKLGIPIFAIVDTNVSPDLIDFPIPGNDDAIKSIQYFVSAVSTTILEAKSQNTDKKKTASSAVANRAEEKSSKVSSGKKGEASDAKSKSS